MILPGSTIGILGGGQLGRMLAQAAQTLGYRVHVFEPQADCPASAVANRTFTAAYTDIEALGEFARSCDVVTYEFENIPVEPLWKIEKLTSLQPRWEVLEVCQNRLREKTWLKQNSLPHVTFAEVGIDGDLRAAVARVGRPCVVKTADFGYDGKGQIKVMDDDSLERAVREFAGQRAVVERYIDFKCELSVIVARSGSGQTKAFPVAENIHTRHILDFSIVPARVTAAVQKEAEQIGLTIADKIGLVGLLAVELFLTDDDRLLINELAPRPHNSGHYTLDACRTSQFEQHIRAICDLPLGSVELVSPVTMVNILGDAWETASAKMAGAPDWSLLLADNAAKLHLYGKKAARTGRKMGHFTVCADTAETAFVRAEKLKRAFLG